MARTMRTVRELIGWPYAGLIAGRTVGNRTHYSFVVTAFNGLMAGQVGVSSVLRENRQLFMAGEECAYCGAKQGLQSEPIIPRLEVLDSGECLGARTVCRLVPSQVFAVNRMAVPIADAMVGQIASRNEPGRKTKKAGV